MVSGFLTSPELQERMRSGEAMQMDTASKSSPFGVSPKISFKLSSAFIRDAFVGVAGFKVSEV